MQLLPGHQRQDIIRLLPVEASNLIGVELGVAQGVFSSRMVRTGRFAWFFGVDMYADQHDTNEYKHALRAVGLFSKYKLLRMSFDEALDLFDDSSLDFVYVDGYAHTGEEGGDTIYKWFRKVKVGGVLAGDDYHREKWPLVVEAVDEFARDAGAEVYVTECVEDAAFCAYPSWGVIKTREMDIHAPPKMVERGKRRGRLVDRRRRRVSRLRTFAQAWLPAPVYLFAKAFRRLTRG